MNKEEVFTLHQQLKDSGISFNYLVTLMSLPDTMSNIATRLKTSTAAVTGLVDKLEKRGLAARVHSAEDRRKVEVQLTPAGAVAILKATESPETDEEKTHGEKGDAPSAVTPPTQA